MKKAILIVALAIGSIVSAQDLSREMTIALKNDNATALKALVNNTNKDACLTVGRTQSSILSLATNMQSADAMVMLINEKKVDINNECGGMTPLMSAVKSGQPHLVNMLLEAGADKNISIKGKKAIDMINGGIHAAAIKELLR